MPIINSVRSTFGPMGRLAFRPTGTPWFASNPPVFYLNPSTYTANAATWTDSHTGKVFSKVNNSTTAKSGTNIVYAPSGSTFGFTTSHINELDVGTSGAFSFEIWLYSPTTEYSVTGMTTFRDGSTPNAGWRTIMNQGTFWSTGEPNLYINSIGTHLGLSTNGTNGIEYPLSSVGTGWKHIIGTYSSSGRKLYVNGSLVASDSLTNSIGTPTSRTMNIGSWYSAGTGLVETSYSDIRWQFGRIRAYNSELSSGTISQIFSLERSIYGV